MTSISDVIFYILVFFSVYVQVFFFVTFFENRKKIVTRKRNEKIKLSFYPKVTITVPCWNEEKTVYKTVRSLLDLNYPQHKSFLQEKWGKIYRAESGTGKSRD